MKMIISPSVILNYVHYFNPNLKKCHQDTRSCVVANVAYLPKVCINHYLHGVIVILKKSRISAKMLKTEDLGKKQTAFMKLIKIQSCHMGFIFTPKTMAWKRQKCVHTHILIMRYHTGNVYWDVVPNVLALIFLTRKQMISIPTPVLQFFFHIYHLISHCTKHGRLLFTGKKSVWECQQDTDSVKPTKIYIRK